MLMLGCVYKAGSHEDGDGNAKDAQKDVHSHFQRCCGVVVEVMLLVIGIGWGILRVKMSLSALTVVVPEGDIGEDLTEVAHVHTFHPTNFPAVALA